MAEDTIQDLVEILVIERLNLDPRVKLATSMALKNLRAFRQISAESGISMDQMSREFLIEKLTKHRVSTKDFEAAQQEIKKASESDDPFNSLNLVNIPSTRRRKKRPAA